VSLGGTTPRDLLRWYLFTALGLVSVAACGASDSSGGGGSLDCAKARGQNCWKDVVAAATRCLPAAGSHGTLTTDGTACEYADGTVVAFDQPLVVGPALSLTGFVVTKAGAPCLRFTEGSGAVEVTTSAGSATFTELGATASLACPNGTTVSGSAGSLVACYSALPNRMLTDMISPTDGGYEGAVVLTLTGTSDASGTPTFDCASP
jgi:hypothetical protein